MSGGEAAVPATLDEAILRLQERAEELDLGRDGAGESRFGKYLTYPKLQRQVRPLLKECGLTWQTFSTTLVNEQTGAREPAMRYVLTHVLSGERQEDTMKLMLDKATSQAQGSALTYAKRYALQGVLDLAPDGDDDGTAASAPARPAPLDPEKPLADGSRDAMLEALDELGLDRDAVLAAAGWREGPILVGHGLKVKEVIDQARAGR